ncbi:hypothetical protein D3C72_176000 [compost metagenome]
MIPRMTLPSEAKRLLEAYFESYTDRRYADHLACYAPDAHVVAGDRVTPRGAMTVAEYQKTLGEGDLASYRLLSIDPEGFAPTSEDCLAALRVEDSRQRAFDVLAWCTQEPEGWRIMGMLPREGAKLDHWPALQARVWAELAQRDNKLAYHPMDLLMRTLGPQDPPKLVVLPESRFTCQDRGECCHVGRWGVEISTEAHEALARVEWNGVLTGLEGKELFRELPARNGDEAPRMGFSVNATDTCVFHLPLEDGSGKYCGIHATVGSPVSLACDTYPFTFTVTPDGVCAYTSFVCRTSASNQGQVFSERETNILTRFRRLQGAVPRVEDRVPWSKWSDALPWTAYRQIETHLLDILGRETIPHYNRLLDAYRFMVILESSREIVQDDDAWIANAWERLAEAPPLDMPEPVDPQDEMVKLLTILMLSSKGHLDQLFDYKEFEADYASLVAEPPELEPDAKGADLLTRFIRRVLFQKRHLGKLGAVFNFQLVLLGYRAVSLYARYRKFRKGESQVDTEDLYTAIRAHDQVMLHTAAVSDEAFIDHPKNSARLRELASGASLLGLG